MFWSRLLDTYSILGILFFLISTLGLLMCEIGNVSPDNTFVIILLVMFLTSIIQLVLYYGIKYIIIYVNWQFIEPYQEYKRKRS